MKTLRRVLHTGLLVVIAMVISACAATPPRPLPPTLPQLVQLSRTTPPEEVIRLLRDSRALYVLSASQLAQLHDQGVSDAVLDYMQATYLEEIRREEAFRQWQYGNWPWGGGWYGPRWGRPYWP